jgi:hypothetical protein
MISGKSSQKNFISYFQTLYNNRINCASVITTSKFVTKSFNERDPMTGADGAKINFNALEFSDRPAADEKEAKLIEDINAWIKGDGTNLIAAALRSHIPGANLVELPLGADHTEIKAQFAAANPSGLDRTFASVDVKASLPSAAKTEKPEPPAAGKKAVELTEEQAKALGIDF